MNKSESIVALSKSLAKFQSDVSDPAKSKENAFLKAKYVTLDGLLQAVRPVLSENGISFLQIPTATHESVTVITTLLHESGEWIESEPFTLPLVKKDPQGVGSAVTYARRYSLSSILGVAWEEDDDGQSNNTNVVIEGLHKEIETLAGSKNIDGKKVGDYAKATFNKSFKQLDITELNAVKSWINSI